MKCASVQASHAYGVLLNQTIDGVSLTHLWVRRLTPRSKRHIRSRREHQHRRVLCANGRCARGDVSG
jgi:hypothetical protein